MIYRFPSIHLGAPGEDISIKDLHAVSQRFKNFNQGRLQRVREFLQPRQHDFLHLLPLLFHQNHPLLPGFVSLETPAGIPDFAPSRQAVDKAKQFSKGFEYKRKALRTYPIHGIFLMGSVGSMAFSKTSDIDIWLCHQPDLLPDELDELQQKAQLIEKWAATLKLEVHFFLVNSEQFRQGENTPISAESSGETQHYLLLEEFYRTSIYVAGRIPIWWLVPPHQERNYSDYVAHLLENRFVFENEILDFGGLQDMPVAEFVSATLWHLYKSLTSPHKSLLKLFLMENYAVEFPEPRWLCVSMKQAIYQGEFSVDTLDPYLLIYEKVDEYLRQLGSKERLNLARECFLIKTAGTSPAGDDNRTRVLRERFLDMIAKRWDWPDGFLENLVSRKFWDIRKATHEHVIIRDQLQQCLRVILKITGHPLDHPDQNDDLMLLSRKLRASLDYRAGKLEVLTTRSMVYAKPELWAIVEFVESSGQSSWSLFDDRISGKTPAAEAAIKRSENLFELLCWAVLNGLYSRGLNLQLQTRTLSLPINELKRLLEELNAFLSRYLTAKETDLEIYAKPNRSLVSLLLVNWGEILPIDINPEQFMMSERSDPLSYGEGRHCFIQSIQKLSVSSWGEVTLQAYSGCEGLFDALIEIINQSAVPLSNESISVLCYTHGRGRSIALRVEHIFKRLLACFDDSHEHKATRYLLATGEGTCCFRWQNNVLSYYVLESNNQLLQELSSAQIEFSPVVFDEYVLEQTFIPFLYSHNHADAVQIFYHPTSKHVAVYIIDEKGSLIVRQHSGANPQQLLVHYSVFFKTLQLQAKLSDILTIKYYEIQKNSAGVVSCHEVPLKQWRTALELRVRIIVDQSGGQAIFCNEKKFDIVDSDSYQAVRNHILSFRKSREAYPFHITEIDVPNALLGIQHFSHGQSLHYLNYKHKVEDKLNI
ncbi:MAG: class I adenylate cyclase [Gammaproteobacteria bacterium]